MKRLNLFELTIELHQSHHKGTMVECEANVLVYDPKADKRYYVQAVIPSDPQSHQPVVLVMGEAEATKEKRYVIFCLDETVRQQEGMYWTGEDGWGDLTTAHIFTEQERNDLNAPIGGEWIELP